MAEFTLPTGKSSYLRLFPFWHLGSRALLRLLAPRWRVTGRQNIPYRGPVILAPNHISDLDPPLIGLAVRYPLWFMGKSELWEISWLAPIISYFQTFPVDQTAPDRAALKFSLDLLKHGEGLVIFPEGKISPTGELDDILPGAVMIALKAGVPVIPVGLAGAQHLIPYGKTRPQFTAKKIHVHFGEALDFSDLKELPSREGRQKATERLAAGIVAAKERAEKATR